MKWDDHRSWVLGSIAGLVIAFGAAAFSVVYASYYNRTHQIAEWGALGTTLRTPVPLWFVFLLAVLAGSALWKAYRLDRTNIFLEKHYKENSMWETVAAVQKQHRTALETKLQKLTDSAPKLHVSWSLTDGAWGTLQIQNETYMSFTGRASFSMSNANETVMLTRAYLPGTKPWSNIMLTKIPVGELVHEVFHLQLKPVLGKPGEDFSAKFIFVDTKGNEYEASEHTFRCAHHISPSPGGEKPAAAVKNILPLPPG